MNIVIVLVAMVAVGAILGFLADNIFKGKRPKGLNGDLLASIVTAVLVGLMDYYVIPMMKFSETMVIIGLIFEPALGSLLVLWLMRRANK